MAQNKQKVEFLYPVATIHGKVSKNEKGYHRQHYGIDEYIVPKDYVDNPTDNQKAARAAFAARRARVAQELHNPSSARKWQLLYDQQKQLLGDKFPYKTLHGFVYAEMKKIN